MSHIQKEVDENIPMSFADSGLRCFAQVKAKVLLQKFSIMCLKQDNLNLNLFKTPCVCFLGYPWYSQESPRASSSNVSILFLSPFFKVCIAGWCRYFKSQVKQCNVIGNMLDQDPEDFRLKSSLNNKSSLDDFGTFSPTYLTLLWVKTGGMCYRWCHTFLKEKQHINITHNKEIKLHQGNFRKSPNVIVISMLFFNPLLTYCLLIMGFPLAPLA